MTSPAAPDYRDPRRDAPPPPLHDALLGSQIGNYRLVRRLGMGGTSTVYLGEHAAIGARVAIKLLHPHLAADRHAVERLFAEARAVNRVGHEHIVAIHDVALLPPDRYFLVMEYLEGRLLNDLMVRPLEPGFVVGILAQLCEALEAAHAAGVIHRDLKPENVFLLRRAGREDFVKLVDFGIARLTGTASRLTASGTVVGTPEYMPPEQWQGGPVDARVDLPTLGVVAFTALAGRLPFVGEDLLSIYRAHLAGAPALRSLNPAVPPHLAALVARALAPRPDERFASAREMAAALRELTPGHAPRAHPTAAPQAAAGAHHTFQGLAMSLGDVKPREVLVTDLSQAGAFVRARPPFPPAFSDVKLHLRHGAAALDVDCEVVRHISAEQAAAWGVASGYAVSFVAPPLGFHGAIDRLLRGAAAPPPPPDHDPHAAALLARFDGRGGDPYRVLGVGLDCEVSEARMHARKAIEQLEAAVARMSPAQREQADALLERIHAAQTILGIPIWRAAHDARRANYRGVARAITAGLSPAELNGLRQVFARERPEAAAAAAQHAEAGEAAAARAQFAEAAEHFARALEIDPLLLRLHQRYWGARRAAVRNSVAGASRH